MNGFFLYVVINLLLFYNFYCIILLLPIFSAANILFDTYDYLLSVFSWIKAPSFLLQAPGCSRIAFWLYQVRLTGTIPDNSEHVGTLSNPHVGYFPWDLTWCL